MSCSITDEKSSDFRPKSIIDYIYTGLKAKNQRTSLSFLKYSTISSILLLLESLIKSWICFKWI